MADVSYAPLSSAPLINNNGGSQFNIVNGQAVYTGCVKIKCPNTKIAISQKFVNIFAPHFALLFNTVHKSDVSCHINSTYAKMTDT